MQWPWVRRRRLDDEKIAASLLRARIKVLEQEKQDLHELVIGLRHQLTLSNLRAGDALEHGFKMARGEPYPGPGASPENLNSAEYLRQHGEPLGGG